MRRSWGFSKDRADITGHALDAPIVAAASDQALFDLSRARRQGESTFGVSLALPWQGFHREALERLSDIRISKSEQKRGRGAAHANTVRGVRQYDGGERVLHERRPIHRLRQSDLGRIPDPEVNAPLVRSLAAWLEAGSPTSSPPLLPQGDPIRHVRLNLIGKAGISRDGLTLRGGLASFGDLVRVDLFIQDGKYSIVPLYAVDVATKPVPPLLSPVIGKQRKDWRSLAHGHQFLFSIYRNSLLRITGKDGRVTEGFFRGMENRTVRLSLADMMVPFNVLRAPIVSAVKIDKFQLDRLGRRVRVRQEVRTWHGRNSNWPMVEVSAQNNASLVEV